MKARSDKGASVFEGTGTGWDSTTGWREPKIALLALLLGCLSFAGCAHYYVSGVTVGAGESASDGKEVTAGLTISPNPYSYKAVLPLNSK